MKTTFFALVLVLFCNAGSSLVSSCRPKFQSVCLLPRAPGPCYGYIPRYHFDLTSRQCVRFIYGGCTGNKNNFRTKQECEDTCTCLLPKITGLCTAYFPRYYFNYNTEKCEMFVYGGCQGNSNNFNTISECYKTCSCKQSLTNPNPICNLPKIVGFCRARMPRYFYNSRTGRCEIFYYGGCGGNKNNFKTLVECNNVCIDR